MKDLALTTHISPTNVVCVTMILHAPNTGAVSGSAAPQTGPDAGLVAVSLRIVDFVLIIIDCYYETTDINAVVSNSGPVSCRPRLPVPAAVGGVATRAPGRWL